jgi:23S rRNA (adenine2030-N6)-methyltransferase
MNYRHAYHAGNFADVVKHAVLCRALLHLEQKPAAFRVLDTHAGSGIYDLAGIEAGKTGEWRNGIGRLLGDDARPLPEQARVLLAPYLDAVAALNPSGKLTVYPGSPAIVRAALRRQDRLIACELEPKAAAALAACLRGDPRAKALTIDGWTALAAYVPPKERRGLVLIDPPFEQTDEFSQLAKGLETAHRKWPTGSYLLWYPIKDMADVLSFARRLAGLGIGKMLRVELILPTASEHLGFEDSGLRGSGLIFVNPPWTLHDELKVLLPALRDALGRGSKGSLTLDWLSGETAR